MRHFESRETLISPHIPASALSRSRVAQVTAPAPDNIRMLIQNYDSNGLMLHLVRAHQGLAYCYSRGHITCIIHMFRGGGAEILHTAWGLRP